LSNVFINFVYGEFIMRMDVDRVDVWAASMEDRPGGLADKLDALAQADIDLEFVNARRAPDKPGQGVVFVMPIKGARQIRTARKAGFEKTKSLHGIRIATGNKPGFSSELAKNIADADINLRAFSGASIGNRAIFYLAFDTEADANKALRLIK
jgi:hypothetical protein